MNIISSQDSLAENTYCRTFSYCILTVTGSCITKTVSVLLPPINHKGVLKGLSRMRANSHVRFLGEGVSVM